MLFIFFVFQYTFAHLSLYIYTYICIFTYKYICYHWPTQFTHDSVFILIGCVDIPTSFFTDVPFTRPPSCLIAWWVEAALHPWISTILDFHVSFLCGKLTWLESHSFSIRECHIFIFSGFFKFRYVCSPDPLIGGKPCFFLSDIVSQDAFAGRLHSLKLSSDHLPGLPKRKLIVRLQGFRFLC